MKEGVACALVYVVKAFASALLQLQSFRLLEHQGLGSARLPELSCCEMLKRLGRHRSDCLDWTRHVCLQLNILQIAGRLVMSTSVVL